MEIQNRLKSNKNSDSSPFNSILGVVCILVAITSLAYSVYGSCSYFFNHCANRDVLSWDENIRLITVYDQYSDFLRGNFKSGFLPFLESPTWPPLRSIITFSLLFFPQNLLVTEWDSLVGMAFLVGAELSLIYITFRVTKNLFFTGIFSLSSFALIFQTIELSAYGLSSMLETQSMFFLVWCYYFLYRFFQEGENLHKNTIFGVSIFLLLFFFTKYPYGLMLFMALFFLEFIRHRKKIPSILSFAVQNHYHGIRAGIFLLVVGMILSLPILRLFEDLNLNQKFFKRILYFLTLPVFLDFQYFLWKFRKDLQSQIPQSWKVLYLYSFLPALVWIYTNPDRVSSLLDAQMIVNQFTKSFFLSIFATRSSDPMLPMAVFDDPWGIRILWIGGVLSFLFIGYQIYRKSESNSQEDRSFFSLVYLSCTLFLQIFILETTTGNKQLRHILQFLPALVWIPWLWIFLALERKGKDGSNVWNLGFQALAGMVFFASILVLAGPRGLWSGNFFKDRYFCLRGEDPTVFAPARWIDSVLPQGVDLLIWNTFHERENFTKKGRLIASEIDLKIRQSRFRSSYIRNDNRYKVKTWDPFQEFIYIDDSCLPPIQDPKVQSRIQELKVSLRLIQSNSYPDGGFCIQRFQIQKETSTKM